MFILFARCGFCDDPACAQDGLGVNWWMVGCIIFLILTVLFFFKAFQNQEESERVKIVLSGVKDEHSKWKVATDDQMERYRDNVKDLRDKLTRAVQERNKATERSINLEADTAYLNEKLIAAQGRLSRISDILEED